MNDDGEVRAPYAAFARYLDAHGSEGLEVKRREAEALFRRIGVTFAVYTEGGDPERLIPFDVVPRILSKAEWDSLATGLEQRVRALNAFLQDVYNEGRILKEGIIPAALVLENEGYRKEMVGFTPPGGVWTPISGIDLVRTGPDAFHVLEDNCRTPSGVSYMLENREAMLRLLPNLCAAHRIAPVSQYPQELLETLKSLAPPTCSDGGPTVVVLTPGPYNSAYYEHSFLADEMGVELVEGADLLVRDDTVYMRTTAGPKKVDVIYRRIDDEFLDPEAFRPDSALGVPGLMRAYRAGRVALANAPGAGVADDKAVYPYVPAMVRFYLGEEPILQNVLTYMCSRDEDRDYVLSNLDKLVVKLARGSGGYGMLVGPHATQPERDKFATLIRENPDDYIAQPTLALSTVPTLADGKLAPRHVDLRPFVLFGREVRIVPGGLTRVALRDGSLVVNSSQGGGTKDTWVLQEGPRQSMGPDGMTQSMGGMTQAMKPMAPMAPPPPGGPAPGGEASA
ncbi:circularly permuted type 2 ATP-grasp protein [Roseomonas sp. OT10]|uniref:circularly permuted type 2 ATP-grasp protein n=1 Tax=Roseomonas cutis TaxID=2897332 RepID=UPI001E5ADF3D|nr:circularly permuted type 2 ATP-grasp protein [Roseomonas sp. OT10]UFN49503.1 circularly permuted type 2 ATP-grasp protein [Roseomonas sp. OT10]